MIPKKLKLTTAIKLLLFNWLKKKMKLGFQESYSQVAEDLILSHMLKDMGIMEGFYLDVGCNHPIKLSNTFKLYLNGWTGMTIDLNSSLISQHIAERKQDIQIRAAVSDTVENVTIYEFDSNLVNTINPSFKDELKEKFSLIGDNTTITTRTLEEILVTNSIQKIDLLCIDVEGNDYKVLKSINLDIYKPKIIVIEMHDFNFEKMNDNVIYSYLTERNYKFQGYIIANGFFTLE